MTKPIIELAWVSELDPVNGIWCVETRGNKFYTYNTATQVRQCASGYPALVKIANNLPVVIGEMFDLQAPELIVCSHLAWRQQQHIGHQNLLWEHAASVQDAGLKEFLTSVLCDAKIMHAFYHGKASESFHHNGKGDLFTHSVEVALTAKQLAQGHQLEQREVDCAFICGLLHDIGKILMFYNVGKNQEKGVNGQHEAFSFMVLAEHLEALKAKDKVLFEAISATLSATTARKKHNEYVVETIVRAADRISAEAYQNRKAFKGKPASQLHVGSKSSKRYKRLGPQQVSAV